MYSNAYLSRVLIRFPETAAERRDGERAVQDENEYPRRLDEILKKWPGREHEKTTIAKKGVQYAGFAEDLHLRMCVEWGGHDLLLKLRALLRSGS